MRPLNHLLAALALSLFTAACSVTAAPPAATMSPSPTQLRAAQAGSPAPTATDVPPTGDVSATEDASAAPLHTPTPTQTPAPLPSPTRLAASLTQLTEGGCCVQPFWYPDSKAVLYLDKPTADAPTGFYRVAIDGDAQDPELWSERIAFYTSDLEYAIIPDPGGTRIIRLSDEQEFRIPNGGRQVQISPDRTRVTWVETRETFPIENRVSNIMLSNLDGSEPRRVTQVLRGGVTGWVDENRLLLNGRLSPDRREGTLFVYDLRDGTRVELVSAERMRLTTLSRDGTWVAVAIVNDKDAERNGLWVVRSDGSERRKLDRFGAAQWRDGARLIVAPLEMGAPTHSFYEYDAATGASRRLTPADGPAFKIASGDWVVSPDGNKIVFVNAADNNLWLWRFE